MTGTKDEPVIAFVFCPDADFFHSDTPLPERRGEEPHYYYVFAVFADGLWYEWDYPNEELLDQLFLAPATARILIQRTCVRCRSKGVSQETEVFWQDQPDPFTTGGFV